MGGNLAGKKGRRYKIQAGKITTIQLTGKAMKFIAQIAKAMMCTHQPPG